MNVGDPVTTVFRGLLCNARVMEFGSTTTVRVATAVRGTESLFLSDEGVTWIRGHHTAGSEEGAALLVAHALVQHGQRVDENGYEFADLLGCAE